MKKQRFFALLALLLLALLLMGCGTGDAVAYDKEHEHVWGFWYECEDGETQIRYCKICQATQTQQIPE